MAETKEEKTVSIFESIEFVLHHPWLFISPFIIIMSVLFAKLSVVQLAYQTSAILSFEAIGTAFDREKEKGQLEHRINEIIEKVLVGAGMRGSIGETWPDVDEKKDPQTYNSLRAQLRSIGIRYDPKISIATVTYKSSSPEICYKVVQATINTLKSEIKKTTQRKLKAGLEFLRQQLTYYKNKIKIIDEEISSIKSELQR